MRTFLLMLTISIATSLAQHKIIHAQDNDDIKFFRAKVVEIGSLNPIPFATAKLVGTTGGVVADENGTFQLPALSPSVTVEISALGYSNKELTLSVPDSLYQIQLNVDNDLPLITVESKAKEVEVERTHLENFRVAFLTPWDDEVVVTYRRGMTNEHLLVRYDKEGNILEELPVMIKELLAVSTRCAARLYLITGKEVIILDKVEGAMVAVEKINRKDYDLLFAGCQMKRNDYFVFEQNMYNGLVRRSSIHPVGQEPIPFQLYTSPVLGNYFRDRYMIAGNLAIKDIENVDRNIHGILRGRQAFADFLQNVMYNNDERNYYFQDRDQLVCFDFTSRRLRNYDWEGILLDEQDLPEKAGQLEFLDQIIQDPANGKFYSWSKLKNDHILFEINANPLPSTNENLAAVLTSEVAKLPLSLIEELCILNGQIYAKGKSDLDNRNAGPTLYRANLRQLRK